MVILKIKYVNGRTAAFTINGELYFLKTGPDLPRLYDRTQRRLMIPNFDYWFQAQTQQRYSYLGVCDMIGAFADGLSHSYTAGDFRAVCGEIFNVSRDVILRGPFARDYARAYRIELLDPKDAYKLVQKIAADFGDYLANLGRAKFHNYLCRLWQFCSYHQTGEVPAVERLISRIDETPRVPEYPTPSVEPDARKQVVTKIVGVHIPLFKDTSQDIIEIVDAIQSDRL
jgi:hypothetical protein